MNKQFFFIMEALKSKMCPNFAALNDYLKILYISALFCNQPKLILLSGADLELSRGGGGLFLGRPIDFSNSAKALICPYFGKIICAADKFLKKKTV